MLKIRVGMTVRVLDKKAAASALSVLNEILTAFDQTLKIRK